MFSTEGAGNSRQKYNVKKRSRPKCNCHFIYMITKLFYMISTHRPPTQIGLHSFTDLLPSTQLYPLTLRVFRGLSSARFPYIFPFGIFLMITVHHLFLLHVLTITRVPV